MGNIELIIIYASLLILGYVVFRLVKNKPKKKGSIKLETRQRTVNPDPPQSPPPPEK